MSTSIRGWDGLPHRPFRPTSRPSGWAILLMPGGKRRPAGALDGPGSLAPARSATRTPRADPEGQGSRSWCSKDENGSLDWADTLGAQPEDDEEREAAEPCGCSYRRCAPGWAYEPPRQHSDREDQNGHVPSQQGCSHGRVGSAGWCQCVRPEKVEPTPTSCALSEYQHIATIGDLAILTVIPPPADARGAMLMPMSIFLEFPA